MDSLQNYCVDRLDRLIRDANSGYQTNEKVANIWGIINICLGLLTTVFSALSTAFTFLDNDNIVIPTSILATILAACLTALVPASRETKRRNTAKRMLKIKNKADGLGITLQKLSFSEQDLDNVLGELSRLNDDFAEAGQNLSEQI